mgnify:CR=1 FL=1
MDRNRSSLHEIKARGGYTIAIADRMIDEADKTILIPSIHKDLSPIIANIALQLLSYETALALGISKPLEKEIRDRAKKYVNAKNAIMKWLGAKTPTNARLAFAEINKCKIKDENIVRDFAGTLDGFGLEEMKRMSQKDMPSPQEAQKQEAEQQ